MALCVGCFTRLPLATPPNFYFLSGISLFPSGFHFPPLLPMWRDCRSPCLEEIPEDSDRRLPWAETSLSNQG